jgi:hypothetical protein
MDAVLHGFLLICIHEAKMKKLTHKEFVDRINAVQRAKRIFVDTNITNNITAAFKVYQEVLAEQEREIYLSTKAGLDRPLSIFDEYIMPTCPECKAVMGIRQVPENEEGVKTQLVCSKCDTVLSSENNLQWWLSILERKVK